MHEPLSRELESFVNVQDHPCRFSAVVLIDLLQKDE